MMDDDVVSTADGLGPMDRVTALRDGSVRCSSFLQIVPNFLVISSAVILTATAAVASASRLITSFLHSAVCFVSIVSLNSTRRVLAALLSASSTPRALVLQ